jgi:hypothetical protein
MFFILFYLYNSRLEITQHNVQQTSVLGSYMMKQLVLFLLNFKCCHRILCTVMHDMSVGLLNLWRLKVKAAWTQSTWVLVTWTSPQNSSFSGAASLIKQFVNWYLYLRFPLKHHTNIPWHYNCGPRLVKPQLTLGFFYLKWHFYNCEGSTSGGKI